MSYVPSHDEFNDFASRPNYPRILDETATKSERLPAKHAWYVDGVRRAWTDGPQRNADDWNRQKAKKANPYAMDMSETGLIEGRREASGMRPGWSMGVEGLTTVLRVPLPDAFDKIMKSSDGLNESTNVYLNTQHSDYNGHATQKDAHPNH